MGVYWVHTDVWGDVQGAYRCMGDVKMYGGVQMYGDHTDIGDYWGIIQRAYRCMGVYRHMWADKCTVGAYRCMGNVQIMGCTDFGGHTDTP